MKRLYFLKCPGDVDLYYNDLYGLRKVIDILNVSNEELKSKATECKKFFINENECITIYED